MQHCCSLFNSVDSSSFLTPTAISCPSPKSAPNRTTTHNFQFNFQQHSPRHSAGRSTTAAALKYLTGVRLEVRTRNRNIDKAKLHHRKDFTSLLAVLTKCLGPVSLYLFPSLSYKWAWLNKKRASHCSFVLKIIPGPEHWYHLTNKETFLTVTNIANKWHGLMRLEVKSL